ncbi:hypothetical protein LTR08_002372 [Meristemomyces frigidus]|nr:hypothetical protein LTR08_002372 [Meristemomyces frigidus]
MSSSDSSSEPSLSPSPPASPEASLHHEPPSLERLVLHFVSAKRSLTSTSYVWGVNELVTSSRGLIEEIAVLNARNTFVRRGVDEQLDTLRAIRGGVAEVGESATVDFKSTIATLDQANARLQATLGALRKTVVDASLHRRAGSESQRHDDDREDADRDGASSGSQVLDQKTLYHFINESTHMDILASLHGLVDSYGHAQDALSKDLSHFDSSLRAISDSLVNDNVTESGPQDKRTIYDEPALTIPQLFHGIEENASEMARLLESLVSHYDLCISALKHTEGGGEAAKLAVQAEHLTVKNSAGAEESLYRKTVPEPMSASEKVQMMRVVEEDAQQVDDVAADIKDHSADIESMHESLTRHALASRSTNKGLRAVLALMHDIKAALPTHLSVSKTFRRTWHQDVRPTINTKTNELAELTTFYDEFLASYSSVLGEVERRKTIDTQMRKLATKAQRDLDRMYEADLGERERFMNGVRHCLPRDLWVGAEDVGERWEVRMVGND